MLCNCLNLQLQQHLSCQVAGYTPGSCVML